MLKLVAKVLSVFPNNAKVRVSNSSVWSPSVTFQLASDAGPTAYIGSSTLDATSPTTLEQTCLFSLGPGQAITLPAAMIDQINSENFDLSDYYAYSTGTGINDRVRIFYSAHATG